MAHGNDNDNMTVPAAPPDDEIAGKPRTRGRLLWRVLGVIVLILVTAAVLLWTQRERIADNLIARELKSRGIPATYEVERIGGSRQVLRNIVVGDPRRPDLTVEEAEVQIRYPLGWPTIGRVTLVRPRLYGTWRRGTLSFGTLDPLIFREPTDKEFAFPDLDLRLADGRALLDSDYGPVGFKAEGAGNLRDGFKGLLAVAAPSLGGHGCTAERASYYGAVAIDDARPRLAGPVRLRRLDCPGMGLDLADAAVQVKARLDETMSGGEGTAGLVTGNLRVGENRAASLRAATRATYRNGDLTLRLDASANRVATPGLSMVNLSTEGHLRARDDFSRLEYQGDLTGAGVRPGFGLDATLAGVARQTRGTLVAPLVEQVRQALQREASGSSFTAEIDARRSGRLFSLVMPQAQLRGGSGAALLDLSRLQVTAGGERAPRLMGNFALGGPKLPRIVGRIERSGAGRSVLRLQMAEYRAGLASLALPQLALAQSADGSLTFVGQARASGPLPNGFARELVVPIEGSLSPRGELAMFPRCVDVRFDSLRYANLQLEQRGLALCPQRGVPIVRAGPAGLRVAFGTPSLDVAGRLGQSPVRIVSGPVGFAYPGLVTAQRVNLALGPAASANRISLGRLQARVGKEIAGTFADADVRLFASPLDVTGASGALRFADGRLTLRDATMTVSDRTERARFEPLIGRNATFSLAGNRIEAQANLHEPSSDRLVTRAVIRHAIASGRGHADLFVERLRFDEALQPAKLSYLALGTVANMRGFVTGVGRIDWGPAGVTSSGSFSTDDLDFAAPFGPVEGLSGTVRFADLLGFVTEPDQEVRVASMNPGIEVTEGVVRFELLRGSTLRLKGATWPFLGGTLTLAPTDLQLGVSEPRRYTLLIAGLDAARFVERMELANISATGIFDGQLPLVFGAGGTEQVGAAVGAILSVATPGVATPGAPAAAAAPGSGHIVGGRLESRPPGGNVSYVGELTYRDLSTMANLAFQTLRSLDYRRMTIQMNGALEGEIVTNVRFHGVRQGEGATRNILTRTIEGLPIQMNINIRAPFYQLITSMKALYDPAFAKDPRTLGLLDSEGRPIPRANRVATPPAAPPASIQPTESEIVR